MELGTRETNSVRLIPPRSAATGPHDLRYIPNQQWQSITTSVDGWRAATPTISAYLARAPFLVLCESGVFWVSTVPLILVSICQILDSFLGRRGESAFAVRALVASRIYHIGGMLLLWVQGMAHRAPIKEML
ncbi:hypothetical protein CC2G_002068 [Coprinopsis cinerea AmutBmut pab1-1]|nr:hypothetical protein CC2G_002068 [Coprinopsis cinerea AmutBmut pab1-1]